MRHAAYVIEDLLKMANKSGRNMLENWLIIKKSCLTSRYWTFLNLSLVSYQFC